MATSDCFVSVVAPLERDGDIVPGQATQSLHSSVMFLFLILSALCAYLDRPLGEVRDRPLYYVQEERNSSVMLADERRKSVVTQSTPE